MKSSINKIKLALLKYSTLEVIDVLIMVTNEAFFGNTKCESRRLVTQKKQEAA